jgi:putative tryptophan/tyrosine transport system substrate-binding protein
LAVGGAGASDDAVVGWLGAGSAEPFAGAVVAFRKGLSEMGFVEGGNVAIEYLWAAGQYDRLPAMAADLVRRRVSIIMAKPVDALVV